MALQDTLEDGEKVVGELSDGTRLFELEEGRGAVLEEYGEPDDPDGVQFYRVEYDRMKDAILHYALWLRVGGFDRPEKGGLKFVPTTIVAEGREAVAAWLFLSGCHGFPVARSVVAEKLNISESTVSRYLSRVRSDVLEE